LFTNPFIFFEIFFDGFIVIYDALLYNIEYTGSGPIVTSFAQGVKKTGLKSTAFCCRGLSFPAFPIINRETEKGAARFRRAAIGAAQGGQDEC